MAPVIDGISLLAGPFKREKGIFNEAMDNFRAKEKKFHLCVYDFAADDLEVVTTDKWRRNITMPGSVQQSTRRVCKVNIGCVYVSL